MRVLLIMKVDGGALHCGSVLGICFSTVQYSTYLKPLKCCVAHSLLSMRHRGFKQLNDALN